MWSDAGKKEGEGGRRARRHDSLSLSVIALPAFVYSRALLLVHLFMKPLDLATEKSITRTSVSTPAAVAAMPLGT